MMLLIDAAFTRVLYVQQGKHHTDPLTLWLAAGLLIGPLIVTRFDLVPGVLVALAVLWLSKVTPPKDGAGHFKFMNVTSSGQPITFSPCRPIHFVVGRHYQPLNAHVLIQQGITALSAATGLRFIYDGDTDERSSDSRSSYQPDRYGDRWAPVLITWADSTEVPDFGTDVLGEAGPFTESLSTGEEAYVSGQVALSTSAFTDIANQRDQVDQLGILEHELAHLVGLDHVSDTNQIMFPSLNSNIHDYQSGDLAGLAALGQGPCQPNL